MTKPIAILTSDIHLSTKPPVCRDCTREEWYEVMRGYLREIKELQKKHGVPVICAGDVFDKWNSPAELIGFAIRELPQPFYALPGQHDLPDHRYEDRFRSAYGVLVEAGVLIDLLPMGGKPSAVLEGLCVYSFPWGHDLVAREWEDAKAVHLAVSHRYVWKKGAAYPGAPDQAKITAFSKPLATYSAALFGDNHKPFIGKCGPCFVFNHGGAMIRKSDEIDSLVPACGILYSDGTIKKKTLACSLDKFHPNPEKREETEFDMSDFLETLKQLGDKDLDFRAALKMHLLNNPVGEDAERIINQAIENDH